MHTYILQPIHLSGNKFQHLRVSKYSLDNILKVKVTTERSKVKLKSYHDIAHLHPQQISLPNINFLHLAVSKLDLCIGEPKQICIHWKDNSPKPSFDLEGGAKGQIQHLRVSKYSLDNILKVKVTTERSKVKLKSYHDIAHLHPQQISLPNINFLHLAVSKLDLCIGEPKQICIHWKDNSPKPSFDLEGGAKGQIQHLRVSKYSLDNILKVKVTTERSKVKLKSYHDIAHLHPQQISLPNINFLHLAVSKLNLCIGEPKQICIHWKDNSPKPSFDLEGGAKGHI